MGIYAGPLVRQAAEQLWQLLLQLQATPGQPELQSGASNVSSQLALATGLASSEELSIMAAPALVARLALVSHAHPCQACQQLCIKGSIHHQPPLHDS